MESDVTQSAWFYKSWAWFETHKKQVAWIVAALLLFGFIAGFMSWRNNEKQVSASEELSLVIASAAPGQPPTAEAYLKVAADHPDTAAAARALMLGASRLFVEGKFSEAQAQFETYLRLYGGTDLAGQAHLGVAASLEALGRTNEALAAYKQVAERRANEVVGPQARLALGRLYNMQGNPKLARDTFQQLARSDFGAVGQEAAMYLDEILRQNPELALPVAAPANAPAMFPMQPGPDGTPPPAELALTNISVPATQDGTNTTTQ